MAKKFIVELTEYFKAYAFPTHKSGHADFDTVVLHNDCYDSYTTKYAVLAESRKAAFDKVKDFVDVKSDRTTVKVYEYKAPTADTIVRLGDTDFGRASETVVLRHYNVHVWVRAQKPLTDLEELGCPYFEEIIKVSAPDEITAVRTALSLHPFDNLYKNAYNVFGIKDEGDDGIHRSFYGIYPDYESLLGDGALVHYDHEHNEILSTLAVAIDDDPKLYTEDELKSIGCYKTSHFEEAFRMDLFDKEKTGIMCCDDFYSADDDDEESES